MVFPNINILNKQDFGLCQGLGQQWSAMWAHSMSLGSRAYWQITNFFWLLPPTPADETACTQQLHLRPGCCLHAVSSMYVVVACGPLTPWLRMVTIQVCTQTRASHPRYHHLKSIPHCRDNIHSSPSSWPTVYDGLLSWQTLTGTCLSYAACFPYMSLTMPFSMTCALPPAQHVVSSASMMCSHMTIPISPGCGWCASGRGCCGCKWPQRECGWCKGRRCEGCQHRLRGAWGVNAGVEGTNGATHGASVGIDGLGGAVLKPPKRIMSYKRSMWTRWATTPPI